jgi:arylsulfatase A-like enzyme
MGVLLAALLIAMGALGSVKGVHLALYRILDPVLTPFYVANPSAPSVVFIVLNNVRADHLSLCGYERPTSPFLESLAKETAFTCAAQAPGSWTLPSHASYFTGLQVLEHGAHSLKSGERVSSNTSTLARPLALEHSTLAEKMRDQGYQTLMVSANPVLGDATGLSRGFDWV